MTIVNLMLFLGTRSGGESVQYISCFASVGLLSYVHSWSDMIARRKVHRKGLYTLTHASNEDTLPHLTSASSLLSLTVVRIDVWSAWAEGELRDMGEEVHLAPR